MNKKFLVFTRGEVAIIRCTKNTFFLAKIPKYFFFPKFFPGILLFFFSQFENVLEQNIYFEFFVPKKRLSSAVKRKIGKKYFRTVQK
jgi:hypothetical protein